MKIRLAGSAEAAAAPLPAISGDSLAADVQAAALMQPEMSSSGIMMIPCWCSPVICWRKKKINNNYMKKQTIATVCFFYCNRFPCKHETHDLLTLIS